MKDSDFKKALKKAKNAENELDTACADMANYFESYFDDEITVLYQAADGFVILHNTENEDKNHNCENESVEEAFKNIQKDKDYYKEIKL